MSCADLTVLYDEDCGLCDHSVSWLEPRVLGVRFVGMRGEGQASESLVVRSEAGEWRAEAAVAMLLRSATRRWWRAVGVLLGLPVIRSVAGVVYRWVAAHRSQISARMGWQACRVRV